jgi:hypothetical protein
VQDFVGEEDGGEEEVDEVFDDVLRWQGGRVRRGEELVRGRGAGSGSR